LTVYCTQNKVSEKITVMMMLAYRRTSHMVSLPAELTSCTNCSIRLVRQAREWGQRYVFWSCADVNIVPR